MKRGKFITLEGGEGVGKSTNLIFLREVFEQRKIPVTVAREPGGTQMAEQLRHLLLDTGKEAIGKKTELLLMFAARAQHIKHVIEPALAKGQWVLCDRFTDSTYAYQGGGRNMKSVNIEWLERFVQGNLRPDLTILLDAPVETGMRRARKRIFTDRFESEQISFFERVREAYLVLAAANPDRIKVIRADRPLSDVQDAIIEALIPLFE